MANEINNIVTDTEIGGNEPNSTTGDVFNAESFATIENFEANEDVQNVFIENGITGTDENGNLIDKDNNIIINKDDYSVDDFKNLSKDDFTSKYFNLSDDDTPNETEIIIDDITYQLNENGDAIDDKGNVFKTADEIKALEVIDEKPFSLDAISALDGYELLDDNGNPIEFEDTPEGIVKREQLIIEREAVQLANSYVEDFYKENPDIISIMEYKKIHGTLKGYEQHKDYSKVELKEDDDSQLKQLIIDAEMKRGRSYEDAQRIVKYSEADKQLVNDAKVALGYLTDIQTKEREAAEQRDLLLQQQAQQQADEYWGNVKSLVDNGKILDYKLPENFRIKNDDGSISTVPRSAFYDYISKPVKDGKTQEQLDLEERNKNTENVVFDALLMFLGGNTEQLIEAAANTKNVKKVITTKGKPKSNRVIRVSQNKSARPVDNIVK